VAARLCGHKMGKFNELTNAGMIQANVEAECILCLPGRDWF
jgi:hypothetical protein